ncbi:hypothetical protein AM501_04390 [Aneurinibacillus migulanus]|nr:hypothetical protein TS64_09550 [Aneurinibacillus migulanus]KPD09414.1 hypothetical protein AM501_04390 [Aneurinibacillus migulanus]
MNQFKFFIYQFLLFIIVLVSNVYSDEYISKPFSYIDFIVMSITLPIHALIFFLIFKIYRHFKTVRLRNKILLSITAFIFAVLFIGLLENIWFEIKGKMLF